MHRDVSPQSINKSFCRVQEIPIITRTPLHNTEKINTAISLYGNMTQQTYSYICNKIPVWQEYHIPISARRVFSLRSLSRGLQAPIRPDTIRYIHI